VYDNEYAVKLLLESGADVNALPYAIFADGGSETREKYMKLLLEAGADINLQRGDVGYPLTVSSAIADLASP
jgi:ankyrin repeat protein